MATATKTAPAAPRRPRARPKAKPPGSDSSTTTVAAKQEPRLKLYLEPTFEGVDQGDGGVRRVVEAQRRLLDVVFVDTPEEADIIACHIAPMKPTLRFLKDNPHVPFVASVHGYYWGEYDWPGWAIQANADVMEATRLADAITAPSEWVAQSIRRNTMRPAQAIPHGVDLAEWPESTGADKGYVLWNKTRVDPVCDPAPLVKLAQLAPDVPFRTTYWPSGEPLPANVESTGRKSYEEGKQDVRDAAVYLCTTRETFGIGTLEAMAAGVPILGWDWAGQAEFIRHEETGWLAPPGDYENLLEGLRWCLTHRDRVGKAARADVEARFQWADVIPAYAALYRRVIEEKRRRSPKVSIIVPAYNLEAFLPEALGSVLAQTSSDWECIVVDDASPDGCGAIAARYMDADSPDNADRLSRFRVIHNETNQYLAGSLNIGIEASKGEYILPFDADNILMPEAVALLADALDHDRSIDVAYGNVRFVTEDGAPDLSVGREGRSGWPMAFRADWQLMQGRNMVPSTAIYRRRAWDLTGGYRRRWRTAEDADFWTRLTSYGFGARMVTEADTLIYRNREGSMSRVEPKPDWTAWFPWTRDGVAPAAALIEPQVPIPSCEPVLISVIIPVGPGHEELVIDAIDSVDAQTFRLWECIVINDTGKPLRWVPSWVRLIETAGLKGVAAARNAGIAAMNRHSKLFIPLDADDTLAPQALALMFQAQQQFGGYVYPDWYEINEGVSKVWNTPEYDASRLVITPKGCLHAVTALYPVDAWRQVGGFDEQLPGWEDWDFQIALAEKEICGTRYPMPLFTYRKDTGMRREANMAAFEDSKRGIVSKWKDYFDGRLELPGCRSCGGGGGGRIAPAVQQQKAVAGVSVVDDSPMVLMEYTGNRQGAMMYKAPSGQQYRFDALDSDRVKLVRPGDVPFFLSLPDFKAREPEAPKV